MFFFPNETVSPSSITRQGTLITLYRFSELQNGSGRNLPWVRWGFFCGDPAGCRHQLRAHGAGKRDQNVHMRRFQGSHSTKDFFIQSLSRSGRVIKPQHKGCKLMPAGYPVERKPRPRTICSAYPHAGGGLPSLHCSFPARAYPSARKVLPYIPSAPQTRAYRPDRASASAGKPFFEIPPPAGTAYPE